MDRLLRIGFEPSGHWLLVEGDMEFQIGRNAAKSNVLYAFICEERVMYIGKTSQPLMRRMAGYKNPGRSQATNMKNNRRMREMLNSDVAVGILTLPDSGLLEYGGFHLNLAAGLEDDLIRVLRPEWNGSEKRKELAASNASQPVTPSATEAPLLEEHPWSFELGKTYFKSGFFNTTVAVARYFGGGGEEIEMQLSGASTPIFGMIDRTANANGTPRIIGGVTLRAWFQSQGRQGDSVLVVVKSPNVIALEVAPSAPT